MIKRPSTHPGGRTRLGSVGQRALKGAQPADQSPTHAGGERDALLRVAAAAAGANDLNSVLELAAEEALQAIGGASLSISRFERDSNCYRTLINVGSLGPGEERYPAEELYDVDSYPMIQRMAQTGQPYFNSLDDPDCDPAAAGILRRLGKSSDLGVPIVVEGRNWGEVWATTFADTTPFRAEDVQFLEAVSGQLANAITRAELFSEVSRLAYEDPLTSLANRRAFDERLERAMTRFNAEDSSVALLLADVDRLKVINDSYGHDVGDRALRGVAKALVAASAELPGSFVARIGGDEFCILVESREPLPAGRELDTVVQVGGRAQKLLAEEQLDVSLSCGVAVAGRSTADPAALLKAADTAQYVAKRRGGSRVYTAAQVAEERRTIPLVAPKPGTVGERIIAATDQVVRRLDGDLLEAPVLDRLEAVAAAYADATDFARWAISFAGPGRSYLRDLSLGENRSRDATGVRVAAGFDDYGQYELDDFPTTAKVIAAGSGSFTAHVDDERSDPNERDFLEREGFKALVGAAAGDDEGVYLIELVTDKDGAPMVELEAALRLAVRAAMPPKPHRRTSSKLSTGHSRALELTLSLADRLADANTEKAVCEAAVEELGRAFNCAVVHLVAIEGNTFVMRAETSAIRTPPNWVQHVDAGIMGRCIREGAPVLVPQVSREPQYRSTDATRDVLSELAAPIVVGGEPWGVVNLEDVTVEAFSTDDARLLKSVVAQVGGALNAIKLYERLDGAYIQTAEALSEALEATDFAPSSRSILENATAVGEKLGMDPESLRMLRYAAALHDIGKLAISRDILDKPTSLDDDERLQIEQHTVIGERILAEIDFLAPVRAFIRSAHERWDGKGYPDGLAGKEIPLGSRILFACDAYDEMTTDRAYRKRMSKSEARTELVRHSGSQFDPAIIDLLLAVLDKADDKAARDRGVGRVGIGS